MKRSEIRETHAQHGTFLIGVRCAELPGLRASHFIQATLIQKFLSLAAMGRDPSYIADSDFAMDSVIALASPNNI
jgi:hypothetical protein